MTVTNGTEKAKIKVATYNYYFAMTYNSMRNRQEQYTQYGLDPADYKLDVVLIRSFQSKLLKMMITKL